MSSSTNLDFKDKHTYQDRRKECIRVTTKYPDKIPCILQMKKGGAMSSIDGKNKYLVPNNTTFGHLIYIIRKRIKLSQTQSIFMFTEKNKIPSSSTSLLNIYNENKSSDGYLYFYYSFENTFGN
jgi:GABA(A) receptor-associated protein